MPGPPSPPTGTQRPSLRWDAAQRACRDNDVKTLKLLVEQGHLFEDLASLQEACRSGVWAGGLLSPSSQGFSTTDSIRLSNLLQTATNRSHIPIIKYLFETFPAKYLHIVEWEVVINAIATGSAEVLQLFLAVDPGLVYMYNESFGTCFTILFDLVLEREKHLPIVKLLCKHIDTLSDVDENIYLKCAKSSSPEVLVWLDSEYQCHESDLTLLCIACHYGNEGFVNFLLDRGANINGGSFVSFHSRDSTYTDPCLDLENIGDATPLAHAAFCGNTPLVKLLLERGADVSITCGSRGMTARDIAHSKGHNGIERLLLMAEGAKLPD